ncbi:MAG TPA: chromate transporter [Pyrinomonadaceae bacterium]
MLENAGERAHHIRTRVRYGQRRLRRLSRTATLGGIFLSFLEIGLTGFGGGLAVISQIRTLVVNRRRWLTEHEFAEAFALAQSLPGTNAGNAVTYVGLRLRGWKGAAVAMIAFILPSMLLMIVLAILYKHLRALPDTQRLFHGFNAAVVALIVVTAWRLGRNTLTKPWQWYVATLSTLAVVILDATIIEVVLAAGLIGIYMQSYGEERWQRLRRLQKLAGRRRERLGELERKNFVGGYITRAVAEERVRQQGLKRRARATQEKLKRTEIKIEVTNDDRQAQEKDERQAQGLESPPERESPVKRLKSIGALAVAMPLFAKLSLLVTLCAIFLRIGAVTFGGGFIMIPLIESEVVNTHGWLTHQEFVDATALGQITPGPVLITATFIGYRVAGTLGALFATISVFLPAFVMTIAAGSSLRRFRSNRQVQAFLRGVTPAVVGLLVAAAWSIGRAGIQTWVGLTIMLLAVAVLLRFRPNPFWVIFGAGLLRFLIGLILG